MQVNKAGKAEEALYGEAIVYGQPVNVLIDSGAVGCIISKRYLDQVGKEIDIPTNIKIINVTEKKTVPLKMVRQVPIQIQDIKIYIDMIVTNSLEYNVLLENEWLKKINANIDYGLNIITIKYDGQQQEIPVTCTQRLDPTKYTVIDPTEELELEDQVNEEIASYYKAEMREEEFHIEDRKYSKDFVKVLKQQYQVQKIPFSGAGPGNCLCQYLKGEEKCKECLQIEEDWKIFNVIQEEKNSISRFISVGKDKIIPIGQISDQQKNQLQQLLQKNADLFATSLQELRQTNVGEHMIITEQVPPIKKRAYRAAPKENKFIKSEIEDILKQGLIKPSTSPWSFPVVVVRKKNGKFRFCVNYKPLNDITKKGTYPLLRIDEILDSLHQAQWFTTLDLASGYWQIKVKAKDQEKTAFITKFGTFEFKVMPFGLCNIPATFQRTMNQILRDIIDKFIWVYLDDVLLYSKQFNEHLAHIEEVFNRIRKAELRLKAEKYHFVDTELQFLGHVVGKEGVKPDPEKIQKMVDYPEPQNIKELRGVLGLFSYYRRFIQDFAQIADPLYYLLKKDIEYSWTKNQQKAFEELRDRLTKAPIVQYPNFDQPFFLYTDASLTGLGAVLAQKKDKAEYVIAYASRTLNPAEKNYGITELECLAVVWSVKYFRHYLCGNRFTIITDHAALKWLLNSTSECANRRLERWKITLSEYEYDIEYRKGTKHSNADAFSRINPKQNNFHINNLQNNSNNG